jgi:hypothetical protein
VPLGKRLDDGTFVLGGELGHAHLEPGAGVVRAPHQEVLPEARDGLPESISEAVDLPVVVLGPLDRHGVPELGDFLLRQRHPPVVGRHQDDD